MGALLRILTLQFLHDRVVLLGTLLVGAAQWRQHAWHRRRRCVFVLVGVVIDVLLHSTKDCASDASGCPCADIQPDSHVNVFSYDSSRVPKLFSCSGSAIGDWGEGIEVNTM